MRGIVILLAISFLADTVHSGYTCYDCDEEWICPPDSSKWDIRNNCAYCLRHTFIHIWYLVRLEDYTKWYYICHQSEIVDVEGRVKAKFFDGAWYSAKIMSAGSYKTIKTRYEELISYRRKEMSPMFKDYKNALENVLNEIRNLEKTQKKIEEDDQFVQELLDKVEFIKSSLQESKEVGRKSLVNHLYLEDFMTKELVNREKEKKRVEQECQDILSIAQEKLKQHPLYRKLEEKKVKFLKLDIKRRDLEVKIRERKRIITQHKEIQKKIFYNFFIKMAQHYLIQQRQKELEKLKIEELEAAKRLYNLQQEEKKRQMLGIPREKKRLTNISFGAQESRIENHGNKIELQQPKKVPKLFIEKLKNLFQQEDPTNVVVPAKVQILSNKVVVPAFETPSFAPPPQKRKRIFTDLTRNWQKFMNKDKTSDQPFSQDSQKLSQCSQQSQASQLSQQSVKETPEVSKFYEFHGQHNPPIKDLVENELLVQYQDSQEASRGEKIPVHCQREKVPVQYQAVEYINVGTEEAKIDSSQNRLPAPALQEKSNTIDMLTQTIVTTTPLTSYGHRDVTDPKREEITKIPVCEPSKSVRFNLEHTDQQTENKPIFGGRSMFGDNFNLFSSRAPAQNQSLLQEQPAVADNSMFNMTLMDRAGESSRIGVEFDSAERAIQIRSPEFSYDLDGDEQQKCKAPEMPPFGGGGGFFSFGKNSFF